MRERVGRKMPGRRGLQAKGEWHDRYATEFLHGRTPSGGFASAAAHRQEKPDENDPTLGLVNVSGVTMNGAQGRPLQVDLRSRISPPTGNAWGRTSARAASLWMTLPRSIA